MEQVVILEPDHGSTSRKAAGSLEKKVNDWLKDHHDKFELVSRQFQIADHGMAVAIFYKPK